MTTTRCTCGADFVALPGVTHCSLECAAAGLGYQARKSERPARARANTTERGYGADHQRLRRELLPLAIGTPCPRCDELMEEDQDLDLDHTDDRSGYRGISHASCNRAAGADRAALLRLGAG